MKSIPHFWKHINTLEAEWISRSLNTDILRVVLTNVFMLRKQKIWLAGLKGKTNGIIVGFIEVPPMSGFFYCRENKGKDGENGKLSQSYVDLICKNQPDFFVFENVKGLYRTAKHRSFSMR